MELGGICSWPVFGTGEAKHQHRHQHQCINTMPTWDTSGWRWRESERTSPLFLADGGKWVATLLVRCGHEGIPGWRKKSWRYIFCFASQLTWCRDDVSIRHGPRGRDRCRPGHDGHDDGCDDAKGFLLSTGGPGSTGRAANIHTGSPSSPAHWFDLYSTCMHVVHDRTQSAWSSPGMPMSVSPSANASEAVSYCSLSWSGYFPPRVASRDGRAIDNALAS